MRRRIGVTLAETSLIAPPPTRSPTIHTANPSAVYATSQQFAERRERAPYRAQHSTRAVRGDAICAMAAEAVQLNAMHNATLIVILIVRLIVRRIFGGD